VLLKLNKLIDWTRLEKQFKVLYKKDIDDKGGERPYDPVKMFKAILLGQWYSSSDPGLEEAFCLRLDFMMFTGFELLEDCPDETTFVDSAKDLSITNYSKSFFKNSMTYRLKPVSH
jgi:transposase, IS5 family